MVQLGGHPHRLPARCRNPRPRRQDDARFNYYNAEEEIDRFCDVLHETNAC